MKGTKSTVDLSAAVTADGSKWGVGSSSTTGKKF